MTVLSCDWQAPDKPTYIEIGFEKGDPVTLDGAALSPAAMLTALNQVAGDNGIGRIDIVESRFVGEQQCCGLSRCVLLLLLLWCWRAAAEGVGRVPQHLRAACQELMQLVVLLKRQAATSPEANNKPVM